VYVSWGGEAVRVEARYHIRGRGWVVIVPNCYPDVAKGVVVRSVFDGREWTVLDVDHHVPLGGRAVGAEKGWSEGLVLGECDPPSAEDYLVAMVFSGPPTLTASCGKRADFGNRGEGGSYVDHAFFGSLWREDE
jgi:hypothetical protein